MNAMYKEASEGILALMSKGLKQRKVRNQSRNNYFQQGETVEGHPDQLPLCYFSDNLVVVGEGDLQTHLYAAKATAVDTTVLRVSLPPKPPPILFTRTTILLSGTPNIFATKLYVKEKKTLALTHPLDFFKV